MRHAASRPPLSRVVIGAAWASAVLVGTGWALVGTAPMILLATAVVMRWRQWPLVLPWALGLIVSQAIAIILWATRETPPPSLTKDLDPIHAGITIVLAIGAAVSAHITVRRHKLRQAAAGANA